MYGVTAMNPDASNYQSVLSIEVAAGVWARKLVLLHHDGWRAGGVEHSARIQRLSDFPTHREGYRGAKDYLPHVFIVLKGRRLLFYARQSTR